MSSLGVMRRISILVAAAVLAAAAGCASGADRAPTGGGASTLPTGDQAVQLDPADFTTQIDNPYWPMRPGSRWVYRERAGDGAVQRIVVTVTERTKTVAGIDALVVHDVASEDGEVVEDTFDWYAQDADGNIWYLGEDTKEYENGALVGTEGSWEAGVDGAQAGIALPAHPEPGLSYRQEFSAGQAEDAARVLSLDELVEVPFGQFRDVLMTKDFTPLEPDVLEHKFYAGGVGPVLAVTISGGDDREELLAHTDGSG
jgi:hypothetical protein